MKPEATEQPESKSAVAQTPACDGDPVAVATAVGDESVDGVQQQSKKVLVVDDDPTMTLLASVALEADGYDVLLAENGAEAVALAQMTSPDIILLDVRMPVMDGFDACARIRELPGSEQTPIVMLTGSDDVDSIKRAYDVGATDFITKPVNYLILTQRVHYMLRAKATADELRESTALLESSQRIAKVGHWAWDLDSCTVRHSRQFNSILGTALPHTAGNSADLTAHVYADDKKRVQRAIADVVDEGLSASIEHRLVQDNGEIRTVLHEIQPHCDTDGRVIRVLGTMQDITERRESEKQIRHLAYYDAVTGLPNRTLFLDQLNHALLMAKRRCRYAAVLFFDLDHFKKVNDTLGHSAGDELLRSIAARLRDSIRDSDILMYDDTLAYDPLDRHCVARLGGDEFVIMLSELRDIRDAGEVAKRICETVALPFKIDGTEVHTTCSVGISCYPDDGDDVESLLKHADAAMYHAKSEGRNQYQFCTKAINARVLERVALENGLRKALEEGEFEVYYQPKVDTQSGSVSSVEALVRWNCPQRGQLLPATFIPVAEDMGLIVPLGEWVLNVACQQTARWHREGLGRIRVAVNLSPAQFRTKGLQAAVENALEVSKLPADCLELELTESILMADVDGSVEILRALTQLGVTIAVDDFGVGYSSLTQLKRFPVDTLKIDQSFVRDMVASADDGAIVAATIALGHSLRLNVIAEGVESTEQLDFLRDHDCDESQGFLFSAAVSGPELETWLREKTAARGDDAQAEAG